MSVRETSRDGLSLNILKTLHTISVKDMVTDAACNSAQVDRISVQTPRWDIHRTPGVNVYVFSLICSSNSRGTSSHWTLPLTDLRPKKGSEMILHWRNVCEKSPRWNHHWFGPKQTGETRKCRHQKKSKVRKFWAPVLQCNGQTKHCLHPLYQSKVIERYGEGKLERRLARV